MGMLDKLFNSKPAPANQTVGEQAVLVYLKGEDFDPMIALSDKLEAVIEKQNVGMFDGNEIGGGEMTLFMYGQDAERLYECIEPVLRADDLCRGARVVVRQGKPGSEIREITL